MTIKRLVRTISCDSAPFEPYFLSLISLIPDTTATIIIRVYSTTPQLNIDLLRTGVHNDGAKDMSTWDWAGLRGEILRRMTKGLRRLIFVLWGEGVDVETEKVVKEGLGLDIIGREGFLVLEASPEKDWH